MGILKQEVEQHVSEAKVHPDVAEGLRKIAHRVEDMFKRLLKHAPDEVVAHVIDGAPFPYPVEQNKAQQSDDGEASSPAGGTEAGASESGETKTAA